MADPKIVITGTGRAGTTLLVRILDALGLDTGIESGKLSPYMPGVRAGLECPRRRSGRAHRREGHDARDSGCARSSTRRGVRSRT